MRRLVAAGATKAEIGRKYKITRQIIAILETVAGNYESHLAE
jgi:hypothetical protein